MARNVPASARSLGGALAASGAGWAHSRPSCAVQVPRGPRTRLGPAAGGAALSLRPSAGVVEPPGTAYCGPELVKAHAPRRDELGCRNTGLNGLGEVLACAAAAASAPASASGETSASAEISASTSGEGTGVRSAEASASEADWTGIPSAEAEETGVPGASAENASSLWLAHGRGDASRSTRVIRPAAAPRGHPAHGEWMVRLQTADKAVSMMVGNMLKLRATCPVNSIEENGDCHCQVGVVGICTYTHAFLLDSQQQ